MLIRTPILILCCLWLAGLAPAATLVWDGSTTSDGLQDGAGNWSTTDTGRWHDGSSYVLWNNANFDSAQFGNASGSAGTVTLTQSISVHDLIFNAAGGSSYTLAASSAANQLVLGGPDTPVINTNLGATIVTTISAVLAGNQGMEKTGTGILTLSGSNANVLTGTTTVTAGTLRLSKTAGVDALVGDIIINGGTLNWTAANQVANTASITLNSGGLQLNGQAETIKNLTLNGGDSNVGTGSNGASLTITDTLTITGTHALSMNSAANWSAGTVVMTGSGTALSMTGNNSAQVSQLTVGAGGLTISGRSITLNTGNTGNPTAKGSQIVLNGNVTASGVNSFNESGTNVGVSQIMLGSAIRTWNVTKILTADVTTVAVALVGSTGGGLTKTGDGTLLLSGSDANTYTGLTTISAGILQVGKTAGIDAIAGDIQIDSGGKLAWTTTSNQIADTASITLNGGTINFNNRTETFANLYQLAAGSSVNPDQANGSVVTITGTLRATAGSSINLNSGGMWTVNTSEFTSTFTGNAIALNGNSTTNMNRYTVGIDASGGMTLSGQSISLSKGTASGGTPATTAKGSELVLNANLTASGTNSINVGGGTIGVAQVNLNGGQRVFNITSGTTTSNAPIVSTTVTLTGDDAVASAGGITKTGAGNLTLNAVNTYTGNTVINAGTLQLGSGGAISSSPLVTVASGATLHVANVSGGFSVSANQTLEGGGSITGAVTVANNAVLSAGTAGGDLTQTLTFNSNLNLSNGSTTYLDLGTATSTGNFGGYSVGTAGYYSYIQSFGSATTGDHDRLSISGNLVQAVGAQLVVLPNSVTFVYGQIFNLLDWQGIFTASTNLGSLLRDGSDDDLLDLDLPNLSGTGYQWDISQFASHGVIVVAPEPGRAVLLLTGLLAFALRRQRF